MLSSELPDVSQWLVYEPRFLDPDMPRGLWFCDGPEAVYTIQINAVCLASGVEWADLPKCAEFVQAFPYVVIVSPDPERRHKMVEEIRRRLTGTPLYVAQDKAFRGCKSIPELKAAHGIKALDQILLDVMELPVYGLLDLADVKQPDVSQMPRALSGIGNLDRAIGGFYMGELSVWTGRRGEGKSTLLGQMLLESIDQGIPVCAYSGELPAWKFKYWTSLQAAGPDNIAMQQDKRSGRKVPRVSEVVQAQIDEWYRRRFFLCDIGDSASHDGDRILKLFSYARNFYGAKVFLVDNIMTARFKTRRDMDYYRAQSDFVEALVSFAKHAGVHVHLVAHPRKTDGKHLKADDVGGIGDITNFADNVFSLERGVRGGKRGENPVEPRTELSVLKNRSFGEKRTIGLEFEAMSKRFYRLETGPSKRFGWELSGEQIPMQTTVRDEDDPFKEGN